MHHSMVRLKGWSSPAVADKPTAARHPSPTSRAPHKCSGPPLAAAAAALAD